MKPERSEADAADAREAERDYSAIFHNPGIAMLVMATDGTLLRVNDTLATLLGRAPEEFIGRRIPEITHPEDADVTLAPLAQLKEGENTARFTKRYLRADGSVMWGEVTAAAVRDDAGRLVHAVGIIQDVTERRKAEAMLVDSQRDLARLLDSLSDGLLILDYNGYVLGANTAMATMLGRGASDLRGRGVTDLWVRPQEEGTVAELVGDMAAGLTSTATLHARGAAGCDLPIEVRVTHGAWGGELAMFAVCRDITERLRAEAELRASQERFEEVFRASPNALVLSDPATSEIIDANHAFEEMAGLPKGAMVGRYAWELGVSLDPTLRHQLLECARTTGPPPQIETNVLTRDGAEASLLVSAHMVEIGGRELLLTVGTDITERKRAEEVLRQSEEQYRQVVEQSGQAIAIVQDGIIQYLNPWGESALGLESGQAVGLPVIELVHPEDRPYARELLGGWTRRGEDGAFDLRVVSPRGGRTRWVRGMATTTRWRGERALLAFVQDVTSIVEAERAARVATARLRQIIDSVPVQISVRDADGRYLLVNRAAAAFHGTTPEEIEGRSPRELGVDEVLGAEVLDSGDEVQQQGTPVSEPFVRSTNSQGVERILDVTRVRVDIGDGNLGVLTVAVDRTAMTHTQQELASAIGELQQTNRDLEQFAYIASHDLREPLRTVSYSLHLLRSSYPEAQEGGAGRYLSEALHGVRRMDRLIQDLLEYSRAGRQRAPEWVDAERVLAAALGALGSLAKETGAQVTWEDLPERVKFDPVQLGLVLQNLLGNAMRFRGEKPPQIHVRGERGAGEWVIHVRDEGIGIDRQDHARIFQMFQRAATGGDPEGTGIGLAICARIVEAHGGRIWVESEPGKGSTFSFSIPDRIADVLQSPSEASAKP